MWDETVDLIAVGAGPGGLASAIAAVDADLDVFVATPAEAGEEPASSFSQQGAGTEDDPRGWLPHLEDPATAEYFAALIAELPAVTAPELSMRNVYPARPEVGGRRAQVETFVGSRLWDWAARCLGSPYGLLFTRVAYWPTAAMRTMGGSAIEVAKLADVDTGGRTLAQWLDGLAAERDIDVLEDSTLQRIVFDEDGRIDGVIVDTPDGPWAVQARLGIAISPARVQIDHRPLEAGSQISLVGQRAGRFGRLEVLRVVEPPEPIEI